MMSRSNKLITGTLMAGMLLVGAPAGKAIDVNVEVGADVLSSYLWRGITVNRDPVIQPSTVIELRSGFAFGVWGNINLGSDGGTYTKNEFSEVDFDLFYSFDACTTRMTIGYIEHVYPGGTEEVTPEENGEPVIIGGATADRDVYVRVTKEVIRGLNLTVTWTRDLSNTDNTYTLFDANYGLQFVQGLVVSLIGSISYGSRDATEGTLKSGMHSYRFGLRTDIQSSENLSLNAILVYEDSLDSGVLPSSAMRRKVVTGAGVYYRF